MWRRGAACGGEELFWHGATWGEEVRRKARLACGGEGSKGWHVEVRCGEEE
uniref:Uncharacterized protein n=1 Tax=Fagus sylvatica TaxID=28930 RepID=A0A2N9EQ77_FAGSY